MIENGKPQKKNRKISLISWTIISAFVWLAAIIEAAFILYTQGGKHYAITYIGCELPFLLIYVFFHSVFLFLSWITWRKDEFIFNTVLMVFDVIITGIYLVVTLVLGFIILITVEMYKI